MVLLHQDGMAMAVWQPLLHFLSQQFQVVAYDRAGHGESQVPPEFPEYTVERGAEVLGGLLDWLALETPILFGASGGALIALEYALSHPDRVPLLILAEPPLHGLARDYPIDRCGSSAARYREAFETDGMQTMLRSFLGTMFSPTRVAHLLRSASGRAMAQMPAHVLLQSFEATEKYTPGMRLRDVQCMTIVLTGEKSSALFKSVERVLATQIPFCMPIRLPGTDHANLLSPTPHLLRALSAVASSGMPLLSIPAPRVGSWLPPEPPSGLLHLAAQVQRVPAKDFPSPVRARFHVPFDNTMVTRSVIDLSMQGCALNVQANDNLITGTILPRFEIKLPSNTVVARGIVRSNRSSIAGIEITSMSSVDRARLSDFVLSFDRPTITQATSDELTEIVTLLDAAGCIDSEVGLSHANIKSYAQARERALGTDEIVLLVARTQAQLEGTAELVREGQSGTWLLQHVGILPSARLIAPELIVELMERAAELRALEHVRTLLRVEDEEALLGLERIEHKARMLGWSAWSALRESRNGKPLESFHIGPLSARDGEWCDATLKQSFSPVERLALALRADALLAEGSTSAPARFVRVASDASGPFALALWECAPAGRTLGPRGQVRLIPASESPRHLDALAALAADVTQTPPLAREETRVFVPARLDSALAERGFNQDGIWLEVVAGREAAIQIANVFALLA